VNIVIIGAGVAGITAAEKVRQIDSTAQITVFSQEREDFYYRTRLPEIVSGSLVIEKIFVHPPSWYREKNIELRKGESLTEISLEERQVRGSLGSRLLFDRLLLAVGAKSFRPPGIDYNLGGVFTFRTLNEALTILYEVKRAKKAVFMGAGVLAIELAAALAGSGLEVLVAERGSRILPRQTTPASSAKLKTLLAAKGVEFILNSSVKELKGYERLNSVVFSDGTEVGAQLLIVSAGITPNLELAQKLRLKIDKAVMVDQFMETSISGIYAAGDCAQSLDGQSGLWTIARQQALIAGQNMVSEQLSRQVYTPLSPNVSLKVAGVDLVAAGNLDVDEKLNSAIAETEGFYRKVVVDDEGLLVGYTILGSNAGVARLAGALKREKLSPSTLKALKEPDFDFSSLVFD
jgi:nitrite reductase (NADH) large subunit